MIIIIIGIQDKFSLTKFSFCIKFHKELSICVLVRVYSFEVVCSQIQQVQWLTYQRLTMVFKLFKSFLKFSNGYHPNI